MHKLVLVYCFLHTSALFGFVVSSECETDVISKIKALGRDYSKFKTFIGDLYLFGVRGTKADPSGFSNSTCQISNFYEKCGKYYVGHNGVLAGAYPLGWDKTANAQTVLDPTTGEILRYSYLVYTTQSDFKGCTCFYSCSVRDPKVSVGSILCGKSVLHDPNLNEYIKKCDKALDDVGLTHGVSLTPCYNK